MLMLSRANLPPASFLTSCFQKNEYILLLNNNTLPHPPPHTRAYFPQVFKDKADTVNEEAQRQHAERMEAEGGEEVRRLPSLLRFPSSFRAYAFSLFFKMLRPAIRRAGTLARTPPHTAVCAMRRHSVYYNFYYYFKPLPT